MPDGGFYLRLVVENINAIRHDKEPFKKQASEISGINIKEIEIVP
jgi:hypothetical protein